MLILRHGGINHAAVARCSCRGRDGAGVEPSLTQALHLGLLVEQLSSSVSIGHVIRLLEHGSSAALQFQQQVIVDQLAADLVVGELVIGELIHHWQPSLSRILMALYLVIA